MVAPVVLPAVPAASFLFEDWETGSDGWTISGAPGLTVDCGRGAPGCSLRSQLEGHRSHHAERTLDIPLSNERTVVAEVVWYTELNSNSMWPFLELSLDNGFARVWINHNEQERLRLETQAGINDFGGTSGRFEWYKAQLMVRGQHAAARFVDHRGIPSGDSAVLPLPEATRITGIRVGNSYPQPWRETIYHFDNVAVYDTPACFPFYPSLRAAKPIAEWPMDPGFSLGVAGGHSSCPTTWTLDFGDGSPPASGTGPVPASVPHSYGTAGAYVATLSVTESGDTRTASVAITAQQCKPLAPVLTSPSIEGLAPFEAEINSVIGSTLERCHATWRLDFGDGTPIVSGIGLGPVGLLHVYEQPGVYRAILEAVRGTESASAQRTFAAGPYEVHSNGTITASVGILGGGRLPRYEHHEILVPTDGNDVLRLTWSSPAPADLNVEFTRGTQHLAYFECHRGGYDQLEECRIPSMADGYVIKGYVATHTDWHAVVRYA